MQRRVVFSRPPIRRGVTIIFIASLVFYLAELVYAYLVDFRTERYDLALAPFLLSADGLFSGRVWQPLTYMWIHSLQSVTHIGFNMLVLYFFGPTLEQRWGTRRFLVNYLVYGMGGAALIIGVGLIFERGPTLGASGAIAGLVAAYCIYHWKSPLSMLIFRLNGMWLLVIFILLDFLRLASGEPISVEGHWGGMLTAAIMLRTDLFSPRLARLRFKRWRLKRRLRLKPGGKSNGDSRYLH
jgi:membrane associated rhomboid family serine protease